MATIASGDAPELTAFGEPEVRQLLSDQSPGAARGDGGQNDGVVCGGEDLGELIWWMDRQATQGTSDLPGIDVDKGSQVDMTPHQMLRQSATGLARSPENDLGDPVEWTLCQMLSLAGKKSFHRIAGVGPCQAALVVPPQIQYPWHLAKVFARCCQPQPEIVILGPAFVVVAADVDQILSAKHDRWMGQGALDKPLAEDLLVVDQTVEPPLVDSEPFSQSLPWKVSNQGRDDIRAIHGLECRYLMFQSAGMGDVIGIHACQGSASALLQTGVESLDKAVVVTVDHSQPFFCVASLFEDCCGLVCRSVIDSHDLIVGECLSAEAVQTLPEKRGGVVDG